MSLQTTNQANRPNGRRRAFTFSERRSCPPGYFTLAAELAAGPSAIPIGSIAERDRAPVYRWLSVRWSALRGDGAARLRRLLPLHALPAAHRDRGCGLRPDRALLASRSLGRGASARVRARWRVREGLLLGLRLGDVGPLAGRSGCDRRADGCIRLGSGDQAGPPTVRRLRGSVGADSGRRPAALPG